VIPTCYEVSSGTTDWAHPITSNLPIAPYPASPASPPTEVGTQDPALATTLPPDESLFSSPDYDSLGLSASSSKPPTTSDIPASDTPASDPPALTWSSAESLTDIPGSLHGSTPDRSGEQPLSSAVGGSSAPSIYTMQSGTDSLSTVLPSDVTYVSTTGGASSESELVSSDTLASAPTGSSDQLA